MMASPFPGGSNEMRVQALVVTVGTMTVVCVGLAACLALIVAAFWLAVQATLYLLQAIVETISYIGLTWVNADPLVKVLILAALIYGGYRFFQWKKKGGKLWGKKI